MSDKTYDPGADAAYIRLGEGRIVDSEEIAPNLVVDYDANDRIVGLEILNVSKTLAPGSWTAWPMPGGDPHAHAAE